MRTYFVPVLFSTLLVGACSADSSTVPPPPDAARSADAAGVRESGAPKADAGSADSGSADSGSADASHADSGSADASHADSGSADVVLGDASDSSIDDQSEASATTPDAATPDAASDSSKDTKLDGSSESSSPGAETVLDGPIALADALAQINQRVQGAGLALKQVSTKEFVYWFDDCKYFELSKSDRLTLEAALQDGQLPAGWRLTLTHEYGLGEQWSLVLSNSGGFLQVNALVAEGQTLVSLSEEARQRGCQDTTHALCDEPFEGDFPALGAVELSAAVEVRVEPIAVTGEPAVPSAAQRDALSVSIKLSQASVPLLLDYFSVGYSRTKLEARLRSLLGTDESKWVQVQEFLFGWVRNRVNTFPAQDDNDVCHGPARQFYSDILYNGSYDRSTEATGTLLKDHYCRIADDVPPRFGDYLYDPGAHSARYIIRDPATGRDIVFSVQSGGTSAYRLWWADEDMSGDPFAHEPMADYRQRKVDVWRRCR